MSNSLEFTLDLSETAKDLQASLSIMDEEYITVMIKDKSVYFTLTNSSVTSYVKMFILDYRGDLDSIRLFRIPRKRFIKMLSDGFVRFNLYESEDTHSIVEISFYDQEDIYLYSFSFRLQDSKLITLFEKFDIIDEISNSGEYEDKKFRFTGLLDFMSVAKSLKTVVTQYNGYIYIETRNFAIMRKSDLPNFTVGASQMNLLRNYDTLYNANNFILGTNGEEVLMVTKTSSENIPTYESVLSEKMVGYVDISINNIISLATKVDLKAGVFILDFNKRMSIFKERAAESSTEMKVLNYKMAPKYNIYEENSFTGEKTIIGVNIPSIKIPGDILRFVLKHFDVSKIKVVFNKSFVQFRLKDTIIVFRRDDYDGQV